jgi:hypothetical protein
MLQQLTNEQINYGMKHFLSKMDVDKITNGEHPEFSTVSKLGMMIRGALNKKLADDLKFTSQMNEELVKHYRNYPDTSEGFPDWSNKLNKYLSEAFAKFA